MSMPVSDETPPGRIARLTNKVTCVASPCTPRLNAVEVVLLIGVDELAVLLEVEAPAADPLEAAPDEPLVPPLELDPDPDVGSAAAARLLLMSLAIRATSERIKEPCSTASLASCELRNWTLMAT